MTEKEESGLVESEPAPSQQVLRPTEAGLINVDRLAESIAREIGYSGAVYALEVVHIQDWVYKQAKIGALRLYREDKPFPFVFDGLLEFHGGLRLASLDAEKVRTNFLGVPSDSLAHSIKPRSSSETADRWCASQPDGVPLRAGFPKLGPMTKTETSEQRQKRRYQMCVAAGLQMPTNDYAALPRGIIEIAKKEGISRQAFSEDVKAHIRRLHPRTGR